MLVGDQLTEKASTASVLGAHQRELKRARRAFAASANRSTVCGPKRAAREAKVAGLIA